MTSDEVRGKYLEFFKNRGHAIIPSASLVPENDPTTLFTSSGMQPLIPYLLGEAHPKGRRVANSQKCFRSEDIEEVGDNRHTTFFEMLGNWSFGDYFKAEQLPWFFEFLTRELKLPPERLYVTVFAGDEKNGIPKDAESAGIWKRLFHDAGISAKSVELLTVERGGELGMQGGRIFYYDATKNWWSRAGIPEKMPAGEPGGADSEVFYEFTDVEHNPKYGKHCHPNCDCGKFVEIGNSVFMEYRKRADGGFEKLSQQNVDFGGGLERIMMAVFNTPDMFLIDLQYPIIQAVEKLSGKPYAEEKYKYNFRVIADHVRGIVFMLAEGVEPSHTDRGYILRRILRRAIRNGDVLGIPAGSFSELAAPVIEIYGGVYENLRERREFITERIAAEETKFRETLERGLKEFEEIYEKKAAVSGEDAFRLFATYGLPLDVTRELAEEKGITLENEEQFEREMERHRELSRTAAAGKFKGGLADHSEKVIRFHTATHLLNAALRSVLGEHVWQKGSNITEARTRFDFTHSQKLTDEEKKKVEELVNKWIAADYPVKKEIMPLEEARKLGAIGVFGEKYPDTVSVYTIYNPHTGEVVSREFCGGPHVKRTGEIGGTFRIVKEEAVGAGVRRVRGVLG